jgi:hypothetical protein
MIDVSLLGRKEIILAQKPESFHISCLIANKQLITGTEFVFKDTETDR